jgi:hypothetical protein
MLKELMSEQMQNDHMDHIWSIRMQTLMKRKRNMEIAQIIDNALFEYYSERGLDVPNWKMKKDPDWWVEYLRSLDEEC